MNNSALPFHKPRPETIAPPSGPRAPRPCEVSGYGMGEAIANTPPPPCQGTDLGPCAFLARCSASGEICVAFMRYINQLPYTALQRKPDGRLWADIADSSSRLAAKEALTVSTCMV